MEFAGVGEVACSVKREGGVAVEVVFEEGGEGEGRWEWGAGGAIDFVRAVTPP